MDGAGYELFFNVGLVQAVSLSGVHTYGAQFIYPFINFVPRAWWPDKPYQIEFGGNSFDLVETYLGWYPGKGAATNAVADTFFAFSWLGCLTWGVFGYYCGRAVRPARDEPSLMNLGSLVACLLACIFWGTQSFEAVFFAWLFTIAPFYGLRILAAWHQPKLSRPSVPIARKREAGGDTEFEQI
jgi:hypothetical protein